MEHSPKVPFASRSMHPVATSLPRLRFRRAWVVRESRIKHPDDLAGAKGITKQEAFMIDAEAPVKNPADFIGQAGLVRRVFSRIGAARAGEEFRPAELPGEAGLACRGRGRDVQF